jgi:hypothetical protein
MVTLRADGVHHEGHRGTVGGRLPQSGHAIDGTFLSTSIAAECLHVKHYVLHLCP